MQGRGIGEGDNYILVREEGNGVEAEKVWWLNRVMSEKEHRDCGQHGKESRW